MRKIIERQVLWQNRPVVILMVGVYLPVLILIIINLNKEAADSEDFFAMVFTIIMMLITALFVFRMSTLAILSSKKVSFRQYPFSNSLSSIALDQIASLSLVKHKWWYGYGYRYSFNGKKVLAMKPGKLLKVVTTNGKTYLLGINREKAVSRFITEEWPNIPFHGK